MRSVLLINPNTSAATTAMMVAIGRAALPPGFALLGIGAIHGPAMIEDATALANAAEEVVRLGREAACVDAVVVAAFGDPGVVRLRNELHVPVIGIGEAAVREAARGGRRFGIATTTPKLVQSIEGNVRGFGLHDRFTGVRVPPDDPARLASDPPAQLAALVAAVSACLETDGAEVVVIGGGPLSDAAANLVHQFGDRIIAPVPAAMRCLGVTPSPKAHLRSGREVADGSNGRE